MSKNKAKSKGIIQVDSKKLFLKINSKQNFYKK